MPFAPKPAFAVGMNYGAWCLWRIPLLLSTESFPALFLTGYQTPDIVGACTKNKVAQQSQAPP